VLSVDEEKGEIQVSFLDAMDRTPILDIKPYTPSFISIE
jgi:tRNA (Thr-GGU) A37 N-methylase